MSRRAARAVFAALLRAGSRLHAEEARHGVGMCLNERDVSKLTSLSRLPRTSFEGGDVDWKELVRAAFRRREVDANSESVDAARDRIGRGVTALAYLREKLSLLASMATTTTSESVTEGVRVRVRSYLMEEASKPDEYYCFAYDVHIANEREGNESVTVLSRKWTIDDDDGRRQEVSGLGIVGKQPNIAAGESFKYTSSAHLRSLKGSMKGSFAVQKGGGGVMQVSHVHTKSIA